MRHFLSNVVAAIRKENNPKRIDHGAILGSDFFVRFNAEDLTMLFSNLYVNAFKYATGGLVKTELNSTSHDASVRIMNEVAGNHREDLDEIWHYEIRGENALQNNIPGEGIGLGLVKDICDTYDIDVNALYKDEEGQRSAALFCVELKFFRPTLLAGV
jgi:signal transduction histidine kinase